MSTEMGTLGSESLEVQIGLRDTVEIYVGDGDKESVLIKLTPGLARDLATILNYYALVADGRHW
jgi:hypothetical protein